MDAVRREALIEKRRLLQLRQKRHEMSRIFREIAPSLRAAGVRCAKLMPERLRAILGPVLVAPGEDERIVWAPIPDGVCRRWSSPGERDLLLRQALHACVPPEERVAVAFHTHQAGLFVSAADLSRHAPMILEAAAPETVWIVAAAGAPWLIELSYWDSELCYTANLPLFA